MFRKPSQKSSDSSREVARLAGEAEEALARGDVDLAVEYYRSALEIAPLGRELRTGLAEALLEQAEESARRKSRPNAGKSGRSKDRARPAPAPGGMSAPESRPVRAKERPAVTDQRSSKPRPPGKPGRKRAPAPQVRKSADAAKAPRNSVRERGGFSPRFMVLAVLFTGFLLIGVGLCHSMISEFLRPASLPEVSEEKLPDGLRLILEDAGRELFNAEPRKAVLLLEEAVRSYPDEEDRITPSLVQALRALGGRSVDDRDYDAAAEAYSRATELQPGTPDNWIELGRVYREQGRALQARGALSTEAQETLAKAVEAYETALEVSKDNPSALIGLGQTYLFLNRRKEAVESYTRAVKSDPDGPQAQLARQHLTQLTGRS